MKEEPSEDLLVIMSMRMDNPKEAELAFNEFYRRHYKFVWNVVNNMAGKRKILREHKTGKEDILTDTFLAALDKADSFEKKDGIDAEKQIRFWLIGILKIQYLRWIEKITKHRKHLEYVEDLPDYLLDKSLDKQVSEPVESIPRQRLRQAMETELSDREREILLSWFEFAEVDSKSKKVIPPELKETFCKAHDLKPDSLRQIKGRAIKKLKAALTVNQVFQLTGKHGTKQ